MQDLDEPRDDSSVDIDTVFSTMTTLSCHLATLNSLFKQSRRLNSISERLIETSIVRNIIRNIPALLINSRTAIQRVYRWNEGDETLRIAARDAEKSLSELERQLRREPQAATVSPISVLPPNTSLTEQVLDETSDLSTFFDALSGSYDQATERFGWAEPKVVARMLHPFLGPRSRVLDVGIGTGQAAELLSDVTCEITGLDISQRMLWEARIKHPEYELFRCDIQGDLPRTVVGRSYDAILAVGVFEFVDAESVIERLMPLLRVGGHLAFTHETRPADDTLLTRAVTASISASRLTLNELRAIVARNALSIVAVEEFIGYRSAADDTQIPYACIVAQRQGQVHEPADNTGKSS